MSKKKGKRDRTLGNKEGKKEVAFSRNKRKSISFHAEK